MRIRFSIRTLVLAVAVSAVVTCLVVPYFRLSFRESISGWGKIGNHYLVFGEIDSHFAWGVALSCSCPAEVGASEVRLDDGTVIVANDRSLTLSSDGQTIEIPLSEGDLHIFRAIDDIETLDNVSGISIEECWSCWTGHRGKNCRPVMN